MKGPTAGARAGLARAISIVTAVIVVTIVVGILLVVLDANPDNAIVELVTDVAETLVGPFERLFTLDDRKLQVAVNWGVAAAVYAVVGRLLSRLAAP